MQSMAGRIGQENIDTRCQSCYEKMPGENMKTQSKSGFRIILLPDLPPGTSREQALDALAERFGISREKAVAYLGTRPQVIKSGLNQQQALQLQKIIRSCGLNCRLDWVAPQPPDAAPLGMETDDTGPPEQTGDTDLPVCPNCGYRARDGNDPLITAFDGMGQCPACNIIVAKFGKARENDTSAENAEAYAAGVTASSGINPSANISFVPANPSITAGGILGGRGKMFALPLGFLAVFLIGYFIVRNDSPSDIKNTPAGRHYSRQEYAAEAARMAEDPTYVSPIVEAGPPPGYEHPDSVAQNQRDRIEAMDLENRQLPESWFDETDLRIEPGEVWAGTIDIKLPFETAYLTIPPHRGGRTVGELMYKDMDLQVDQNPWKGKGVRLTVTGQWVSNYDFNIWVMAENGRVTGVLYPQDSSLSLEALGQLSAMELREIQWSRKSNLPADFDPVFDLVQGWGNGCKVRVGLTIEVPESLADYHLGKFTGSHAETVYLKDRGKENGIRLSLTLAKKRGDPALYFRPGKYLP
jgi:hypothetical protein